MADKASDEMVPPPKKMTEQERFGPYTGPYWEKPGYNLDERVEAVRRASRGYKGYNKGGLVKHGSSTHISCRSK